jgi:hypothetical protein
MRTGIAILTVDFVAAAVSEEDPMEFQTEHSGNRTITQSHYKNLWINAW